MKFLLVARRDLGAYFNGIYGYVIIALLLVVTGLLFNGYALLGAFSGSGGVKSATALESFFTFACFSTGVTAWLLSFGAVAGEKERRTHLVLFTSPLSDVQIVVGKYVAVMAMVAVYLLLTLHMPLMIYLYGKVSVAQIGVGYLGLLLYGSVGASIGLFGSSLVRNQILAALISLSLLAVMIMLWLVSQIAGEGVVASIFEYAAIYDKHFQPFSEGLLGLDSVVYYLSLTGLFLLLATRSLERRRWQ